MKRFLAVFTALALAAALSGCSQGGGDDLNGIPAVTVTFKAATTAPQPKPSDLDKILPIIEAVVRAMAAGDDAFLPEDGGFFWDAAARLATGPTVGGENVAVEGETITADESFVLGVASVLLSDPAQMPEPPGYDAETRRYSFPLPAGGGDEGGVTVSDVLEDGGGTLTAYVDLGDGGVIAGRYILTLVKNDRAAGDSPLDFSYTVKAAVLMEQ